MKFTTIKKFGFVLLLCNGINLFAQTSPPIPGGEGKGGGGIKRKTINGYEYLTFADAKIKLREETLDSVPGLIPLEQAIGKTLLDDNIAGKLVEAIVPIGKRQYYSLSSLSPENEKLLLDEYWKAISHQVPRSDLVVYAISVKTETYLLPRFYKLKRLYEKMAILFHEAMWVNNPNAKYKDVLQVEEDFQNYIEREFEASDESSSGYNATESAFLQAIAQVTHKLHYTRHFYHDLADWFSDPLIALKAALEDDKQSGRFDRWLTTAVNSTVINSPPSPVFYISLKEVLDTPPSLITRFKQITANPEMLFLQELYGLESDGLKCGLGLRQNYNENAENFAEIKIPYVESTSSTSWIFDTGSISCTRGPK